MSAIAASCQSLADFGGFKENSFIHLQLFFWNPDSHTNTHFKHTSELHMCKSTLTANRCFMIIVTFRHILFCKNVLLLLYVCCVFNFNKKTHNIYSIWENNQLWYIQKVCTDWCNLVFASMLSEFWAYANFYSEICADLSSPCCSCYLGFSHKMWSGSRYGASFWRVSVTCT